MPGYRIKYSTLSIGAEDYHLCSLRDNQQFAARDGAAERAGISDATWPLFGQLWPSGEVLACSMSGYPAGGLRILELGCGLGRASQVLQRQGADITARDYHPLAGEFLARNAALNQLAPIACRSCGWTREHPELGRLDLIIGSDLLYGRDHPEQLADFIDRHSQAAAEVLIVDPRRGNTARFNRAVLDFACPAQADRGDAHTCADQPFSGRILRYTRSP